MSRTNAPASTAPRVNLLPRSELERRERDRLGATWLRLVIAAVALAALLVGAAFVWNVFAQQRLAAEQAKTTGLLGEISALSEVSRALSTERDLIDFRAESMGSDIAWADVLNRVQSAVPPGDALIGFELTPGAAPAPVPAAADDQERADAASRAVGLTGTVTVQSGGPENMIPFTEALRSIEGVAVSDARALSSGEFYQYVVDITFDQSVYSGQYALDDEEAAK
ncbi:hypothetical protein FVO59_04395 [Microbacterium esteraromaticum]|uniref:PilN domain-containing protein n=1 Tax=Microbacterium esteraromaticum TaxID=57043 RepID=A0A7D7WEN6_9MICO|nr:hypothetical protein [Microbacterium esteraromaticum]QMU96531.1 hypothetical protein FVO59_04395 [Microbacterium esteraromaticum]